jgi:hypothetical protein
MKTNTEFSGKIKYVLYILFAVLSAFINIGTQAVISLVINGIHFFETIITGNITFGLIFKMVIATIVAFIFKFFIDKFFIFNNKSKRIAENLRQILFYGFFAVFTTLIFWSFELFFKYKFIFPYSEYAGAVTGLAIGYTTKFFLDSKFVFLKENAD